MEIRKQPNSNQLINVMYICACIQCITVHVSAGEENEWKLHYLKLLKSSINIRFQMYTFTKGS